MLIIKQGKVGLFHCHTEMPINGSSLNRALLRVDSLRGGLAEGNRIYLFDIVTTHHDQPSYVKHVLGRICLFFTLFGCWVRGEGGGGGQTRLVHNLLANAVFQPIQLKNRSFQNLSF